MTATPRWLAVLLAHLVDPGVGGVADEVLAPVEGDAVERRRGGEDAVGQHAVELEVGPQGALVELRLLLPQPAVDVRPVPGFEGGAGLELLRGGPGAARRGRGRWS